MSGTPGQDIETRAPGLVSEVVRHVLTTIRPVTRFLEVVGEHFELIFRCVFWAFRRPFRGKQIVEACEFIGVGSLPIIGLVGMFTGMVTALQAVQSLKVLSAEGFSGSATGIALSTELGPVLTGLMLSGRAGAGIATELGTMRISEQIDALDTMAVSPVQFLVLPRVVAGILMTPLLMLVFFGIGMLGAYVVAVYGEGVDHGSFVENYKFTVDIAHVIQGIVKSLVFGLAFSTIGCYQGYNAAGGGRGVGLATTRAVVIGSVSILILDFFLTKLILPFMPPIK